MTNILYKLHLELATNMMWFNLW